MIFLFYVHMVHMQNVERDGGVVLGGWRWGSVPCTRAPLQCPGGELAPLKLTSPSPYLSHTGLEPATCSCSQAKSLYGLSYCCPINKGCCLLYLKEALTTQNLEI